MSLGPTDAEVERAKSQLKASLLLSLGGPTAVAEDIQLVTSGCRMAPQQTEDAVMLSQLRTISDLHKNTTGEYIILNTCFPLCLLPRAQFTFA